MARPLHLREGEIYRIRLPAADEVDAEAISDGLLALVQPETVAAGSLETEKGWIAEAFYTEEPDMAALAFALSRVLGRDSDTLRLHCEALADRDWVRESLEAMPPVEAGRFVVFGAHDRERVARNRIGIEIEAGPAFGTGHHGTTRGCLLALDRLLKSRSPQRMIDVGTGTGVLAIALAKATRRTVTATDIDPVAVRTAIENVGKNGVGRHVRPVCAAGLDDATIRAGAPYDLMLANILARPLIGLAPQAAPLILSGGVAILSGLLTWQQREVEAAWRGVGLAPLFRLVLDGWVTLVLEKRRLSGRRASG